MTEQIENGVTHDRSYWPECGTIIPTALPTDLNDLWDRHGDQAEVFVAEALISNAPHAHLSHGQVEVFLWSVGGDTLVLYQPFTELIEEVATEYSELRSDAEADDVRDQIAELEKIEAAITAAKIRMHDMVAAWEECGE